MKTVLFTGTHGHELRPIAGKLPKDTDVLLGDIAARNESHTEQIPDPFGILLIVLVAFHGGNPFRVSDHHVKRILKDIPDRNPVLAGAFHTDIAAVVVNQSLSEQEKLVVVDREAFLLIFRGFIRTGDDGGDEKGFVNIDAAADGIRKFHAVPPHKSGRDSDCAITQ